jgi:ABC-type multidrug transport system ATPase subunit
VAAPEDPHAPARPTVAARLPLGEPITSSFQAGRLSAVHAAVRLVRIGREPDNDIVVEDILVSRHHAELRGNRSAGYELVDLDSHNGTFVNGKRVRKAQLEQLDVVGIGRTQFRLVGEALEEYVDTGEISFEAVGVTVEIDGRRLVDDLALSVRERALVGIVGPSGAGKSMLLDALSGRRPATSGTVFYDGVDLYAHYEELRSRIGFVPQDDVLYRELRVSSLLGYAAELAFPPDVPRTQQLGRIDEVLDELGLAHRRGARVEQLSGGERKRVGVAIELLTKPSLLFLDEPTSGLDPGYERTLMELLRALADGGRTIIVVTHSIQSLRLCDRVLVLAPGGSEAYFGPPQFAPSYFGRDDFQQIFQDLTGGVERDWSARFRAHPHHERFLGGGSPAPVTVEAPPREPVPIVRRGHSLQQFWTLTRRNVELLASDRRNLALLALQAPALGLIMLLALPQGQLGPAPDGTVRLAAKGGLVLLTLVMAMTWLGASNAVREIVRELPIFRRERALGVSIAAYLGSKTLVLGGVVLVQAAVLVALATARQGGPIDAVVLGSPRLELIAAAAAAGLAAVGLGLLVSAVARRLERAMTALPVILILELILGLGGIAPEMIAKPGLKQLSYVASTQWAFSASASTTGLNDLEPLNSLARAVPQLDLANPTTEADGFAKAFRGEPRWDHTASAWATSMLALLGLSAAAIVAAGFALRRLDRQRL